MPDSVDALIAQLSDPKSDKRRSAAKKLRKLGDPTAGSALFEALQSEVRDKRTWETQYQLIMAVGTCGYREALPFLESLLEHDFGDATMQYLALGDAIARLEKTSNTDAGPVLRILDKCKRDPGNERLLMAADGALRALAMQKIKPDREAVSAIIRDVTKLTPSNHHGLPFWALAAAAGWDGPEVQQFVQAHATSPRNDIQEAVRCAQTKTYGKWSPL